MFEKFSELCESNLPIPIGVQLLHQGHCLLPVHLVPQLAELPSRDVSAVVTVNCLQMECFTSVSFMEGERT